MALVWVCPGNNGVFCGGEVRFLNMDECQCTKCGQIMPKGKAQIKRVWSRMKTWYPAKKVEKVEELLQPPSQVHEEPAEPFLPQIPEKSEECLKGIFCCVAGEKEPATHNDLVNFFNTPVFSSSCQMIVKGRKVVVDYSSGVEAMIKRGRRVVWRGSGEELRTMAKTNPTVALMDWAAKSSK